MSEVQQARVATRMVEAATTFLDSLRPDQHAKATAPFDSHDFREWTYLPGPRPGLPLAQMDQQQRELAMALLETGLSKRGFTEAKAVMALEVMLRDLERRIDRSTWRQRDPVAYWFRVLGDPGAEGPWAWRVNGHHLAAHFTVVGDRIAGPPQFFGANPATVPDGPDAGLRTLPGTEDLARAVLEALDPERLAVAIVDDVPPSDILTRYDPVADPDRIRRGLAYGDMSVQQQEHLATLIRHYLDRVTPEASEVAWNDILQAGIERTTFSWAGPTQRGQGHYYAIAGPTFLVEYDNTQNGANHIHSVWRDLRHDWGEDLLAGHYAEAHAPA